MLLCKLVQPSKKDSLIFSRSQALPGNVYREALPPLDEAEPRYLHSQAEPGNELKPGNNFRHRVLALENQLFFEPERSSWSNLRFLRSDMQPISPTIPDPY
jgi:hypothetical protein